MKKQNQKGALLVEVIAVLGLIALITPILFHQLQRRNEEIVDAQIASEMRAVKDALSAYIQANESTIAWNCNLVDDDEKYINVARDTLCTAHPMVGWSDYSVQSGLVENVYTVKLYAGTIPSKNPSEEENDEEVQYRPVIYAIAWKTGEPEPDLRRASKVAAMIGIEGGVFDGSNTIQGMQGVWSKTINENVAKNTVAVTTSFDATTNSAILKDATFSHLNAQTVQGDNVAGGNLATKGILSVADESCIVDYGSDSLTIRGKGTYAETTCAPVFEVNGKTGELTIAGVIKANVDTCSNLTQEACNAHTNCSWSAGRCSRLNDPCSGKTTKTDCAAEPSCLWRRTGEDDEGNEQGTCTEVYNLNLAETSIMNDIRLESRGGAKLSEILPNWSLKNVRRVPNGPVSFAGADCPAGSSYAIVVVPTNISSEAAGAGVTVSAGMATDSDKDNVQVDVSGVTGEGALVHEYCVFD